jgi:hypothetical protein
VGMRGDLPGAGSEPAPGVSDRAISEPAPAAKAKAFALLVAYWGVYWGYGVLSLVIYALAGAISDRGGGGYNRGKYSGGVYKSIHPSDGV